MASVVAAFDGAVGGGSDVAPSQMVDAIVVAPTAATSDEASSVALETDNTGGGDSLEEEIPARQLDRLDSAEETIAKGVDGIAGSKGGRKGSEGGKGRWQRWCWW